MEKIKGRFGQGGGKRAACISGLVCLFLATGMAQAPARSTVHGTTVTVTFADATLRDVIWELQKQTDFTFVYSTPDVQAVKVNRITAANEDVHAVLDRCLRNTGLTYTVHDGVVAIRRAETGARPAAEQQKRWYREKCSTKRAKPFRAPTSW